MINKNVVNFWFYNVLYRLRLKKSNNKKMNFYIIGQLNINHKVLKEGTNSMSEM